MHIRNRARPPYARSTPESSRNLRRNLPSTRASHEPMWCITPRASPSSSSTGPFFPRSPPPCALSTGAVPHYALTQPGGEESTGSEGPCFDSTLGGVSRPGIPRPSDTSLINWISSADDKDNRRARDRSHHEPVPSLSQLLQESIHRCGRIAHHGAHIPSSSYAPFSIALTSPGVHMMSPSLHLHAGYSARTFATKCQPKHFLVTEERKVQVRKKIINTGKWVAEKSFQLLKVLWSFTKKTGQLSLAFYRNPAVVHVWWKDIKEGTNHMIRWTATGFRLFGANIRISTKIMRRFIQGYGLTLRERKLLVRTTGDIFKIIPFSFFIIIPFAELLLPVFIRIFPNMLPSTFFEDSYDNATLSRKLKAKQELASFFQEVVHRRTKQILQEDDHAEHDRVKELEEFQQKLMEGSEFPSPKEVLRFSKLFRKEFKFENMDMENLEAMCRILGLNPGRFRPQLVLQLRHHVTGLRLEDRDLLWEGVENLSTTDLIEHCKARAIRFDVDTDKMREWLGYWLELSSHKQISISLLLWCQTFFISSDEYVKKAMMVDTSALEDKTKQVPESDEPALAFSKMKERRQIRLEEAEEQLEELKRELKSMEETVIEDHAVKEELGLAARSHEGRGQWLQAGRDAERSHLGMQPKDPLVNDVCEVEVLDEDLHNYSSLEITQLAKTALFREITELQQQRDHGVKLATKQHDLLKILLEFISQMRQNEPTINKNPDCILLDQRARLVKLWHQSGDDFQTIEQELDILMKLVSRPMPKELEEAIKRLQLAENDSENDSGPEDQHEDTLEARYSQERLKNGKNSSNMSASV